MAPATDDPPSTGRPAAVFTFLFSDIEGSTRLWERHPGEMGRALECHDTILRAAIEGAGGIVFKTVGDAFCAAFEDPAAAVAATLAAQRALAAAEWPAPGRLHVRMAVHTGPAEARGGDYFGRALNRCARLEGIAHGDQVLLSQDAAALVGERLPVGAALRDLGSHRLRDLGRAERVYQLCHEDLVAEFAPLKSLDALPNNLPARRSAFIGREAALAQVAERLGATRLLTLKGAGGIGKTRLALQVAADVQERFPDGVWLVELAPVEEPELVAQAVATALGIREEPGQPLAERLADALRDQRLLVVLDNCEHLVEAAAALAAELLDHCPALWILATSREPLAVEGELVWPVPPLELPDVAAITRAEDPVAALLRSEAALLFAERAREAAPAFRVTPANAPAIAEICRQLEGLALAIELAAARTPLLAPAQIVARLDQRLRLLTGGRRDGLRHQQTLREAIAWSYDLCGEAEQALLRRLTVFRGGWSLEAAEATCAGAAVSSWDVLDLLGRLVDRSLVEVETADEAAADGAADGQALRYDMLESIRQFAAERSDAEHEAEATARWRSRHLAWYAALAAEAEDGLKGPEQAGWRARLDAEHDNLAAALDWAGDAGELGDAAETAVGLRLGGRLWRYWYQRGRGRDGLRWLRRLLELPDGGTDRAGRALALHGAGTLATQQGDLAAAQAWLEESLAERRALGDLAGCSATLNNLAIVANQAGRGAEARAILTENLAVERRLGPGPSWSLAITLHNLATAEREHGDFGAARERLEESLGMWRALGDERMVAATREGLGLLSTYAGDFDGALAQLEASRATFESLNDRAKVGHLLRTTAVTLRASRRLDEALVRATASLDVFRALEDARGQALALAEVGRIRHYGGDGGAARLALEEGRRLAGTFDDAFIESDVLDALGRVACGEGDVAIARACLHRSLTLRRLLARRPWLITALESHAVLAAREGRPGPALFLAAAAQAERERIGLRAEAYEADELAEALAQARASLDATAAARAEADGRAMGCDEAVERALAAPNPAAPNPARAPD
jgi:predicted ATPase/class 3 adenylate cyclase